MLSPAETDWALYTLIGQNELKLVGSGQSHSPPSPKLRPADAQSTFHSTGSGGLDEMEDEWSDGKVMWGFVRVKDPYVPFLDVAFPRSGLRSGRLV